MGKKVAIGVAFGVIVALLLPVFFIVWYTMSHRLPGIGPFDEGSPGSSFVWMFAFAFIYAAIFGISVKIINRIKRRG